MPTYGMDTPRLAGFGSNNEERRALSTLECALRTLFAQHTAFHYAVRLYQHSTAQAELFNDPADYETFSQWKAWALIGAREGALRLAEFHEALQATNIHFKNAFGHDVKRPNPSPDALLHSFFPNLGKVRHSAAHVVVKTKNQRQLDQHGFDGSYEAGGLSIQDSIGTTITDAVIDDIFTANWDGQIVSYPVTMASVDRLEQVKLACIQKIPWDKMALATRSKSNSPSK